MKNFNKFLVALAFIGMSAGAFAQTPLPQSGNLSGQYTATPGSSYSGPYNLTGTTIIWVNSGTATITGVISGNSSFVFGKEGAGTLILTATNNYAGQTGISGGTLQVGNGTSGSINSTSAVQVSATSATLCFNLNVFTTIFSKDISGTGKVEKTGNNTLYLTGTNTYTGTTTIEAGSLCIGNNTTTGSVAGDIINNGTLSFDRSNDYIYSKVISGSGQVYKAYTGKVTLTGVNTYAGSTWVNGGTLQIGNGTSGSINSTQDVFIGTNATLRFEPGTNMTFTKGIGGEGKVQYKGGTNKDLRFTGYNTYSGATTIEAGQLFIDYSTSFQVIAGDITVNSDAYLQFYNPNTTVQTYGGVISGGGNVRQAGSGKTILTGVNTYFGKTNVFGGTLQVGNGSIGSINNTSEVEINSGALRFEPGANTTFSKVISGQGGVEYQGANKKLTLTAVNTYFGTTTVVDGTLQIGNGSSGSIANTSGVTLTNNSSILRFQPGADMTFSKDINGLGKVEYSGDMSRTLVFTGENSYTGTTTIQEGSFSIGDGGSTGKVTGSIVVSSGLLVFNRNDDYTYTGFISGGGTVYQWGTGKTILTGVNSYTGPTAVVSGTLQVGNGTYGSINSTQDVFISPDATLCFQPGANTTFSKVISGQGGVEYQGANKKLTLTAVNTYSGTTTVVDGTLQIGDGSTGSIANTSKVTLTANSSILRFEPGANMTFGKVIEGTGKVEYKGTISKTLTFTGENSYTGTTTIEANSDFYIGNGGTSGRVQGDILNSGYLNFNRSNEYTYSKVISGIGVVQKSGSSKVILTGVNIYTGATWIDGGTLQIGNGASGSINGTSHVAVGSTTTLHFEPGAVMTFAKQISGNGNVVYKGAADKKLILTAPDNTCTGLFTLESGSLEIVKWAGAFTQAAGTTLDIKGDVSLGSSNGAVTLQGGDIYMNLTTSPPSKLTAVGAIAASGTTTLHITTGDVTNQTIIQAASGLGSATPFALDMPGYTASLTATGTQLQLTATTTDVIPPVPGTGVNGTAAYNTANLSWTAATDNETPPENLRYYVYQSSSNNITTVANCETNGTLLNDGGSINITAYDVTALTPQTTYYFNVVVADMTNNKAAYIPKELTTGVEPTIVSIAISPETATVQPGGTQQFTATVVAEGGADESVTWSVSGNYSTLTTITADGLLTVGSNETATTITVTATSAFDPTVSDEAVVTVTGVGIDDDVETGRATSVQVYPNPTNGELTIESVDIRVESVDLFDIYGKNVGFKFPSKNLEGCQPKADGVVFDISHFPAGIYFLKIHTEKGIVMKKVVKQ